MLAYREHANTKRTSQREPILGRTDMVKNNAGGYGWAVDDKRQLDRFLILGSEGGTYYVSEKKLTKQNAQTIAKMIQANGPAVVQTVVEVSDAGRAASNDPALFVLAMCAGLGNDETRRMALDALPKVARTGTHLFHFVEYVEGFRGWGRGLRRAIREWYVNRSASSLALQLTKYQSRDGWSHRDLLRLAHFSQHATTIGNEHQKALTWAAGKADEEFLTSSVKFITDNIDRTVERDSIAAIGYLEAFKKMSEQDIVRVLKKNPWIPMELIPTEKRGADVYAAIYPDAGLTWLLRNLGNLSKHKILSPGKFSAAAVVAKRFTDREEIRRARLHPLTILNGLVTYQSGHGFRGSASWDVNMDVVDALDQAFYLAFDNVEPTNKRRLLALDVSGSMSVPIGKTSLSCREASAALAMITYKTEPQSLIMCFATRFERCDLSRLTRLSDVVQKLSRMDFGGTDCSLPMAWATKEKLDFDAFEVYTDSETWAGRMHPSQALAGYRQVRGIEDAKLVVMGMVSNNFTIADPKDKNMLDVVGFDTNTPVVVNQFIRGEI